MTLLPGPVCQPFQQQTHEQFKILLRCCPAREMLADICAYVDKWLPCFIRDNRAYLTVAIGCTGGRHRSVYFAEALAAHFSGNRNVLVRHRELSA